MSDPPALARRGDILRGVPRPLPYLLEIPRRSLVRRDFIAALVYRTMRTSRTDMARAVVAFELKNDEFDFARALLERKSHYRLFRSNQRSFCGDFVVVDVSSPEVSRRRAVVIDLKQGAPLKLGGGGAGVQLRNAGEALRELARLTAALAEGAPFEIATGDAAEVLAFFGAASV